MHHTEQDEESAILSDEPRLRSIGIPDVASCLGEGHLAVEDYELRNTDDGSVYISMLKSKRIQCMWISPLLGIRLPSAHL